MKHKHAELFNAIADGESLEGWEYKTPTSNMWAGMYSGVLSALMLEPENRETRRKPRTIRIGDLEVPEPLRTAPAEGTAVYITSTTGNNHYIWTDGYLHKLWLKRGVVHLTKEAAEQASYNDGLISRLSNYIKESTECLP